MHERTIAMQMRRVALGRLTQFQVAKAAGMDVNRYNRIENCVYEPTAEERKAIAKALKAKPAELFPEQVSA